MELAQHAMLNGLGGRGATVRDKDKALIQALAIKRSSAQRAFAADPSPLSKAKFLAASSKYERTRYQLDPEFRKAKAAAQRKSYAKKKERNIKLAKLTFDRAEPAE